MMAASTYPVRHHLATRTFVGNIKVSGDAHTNNMFLLHTGMADKNCRGSRRTNERGWGCEVGGRRISGGVRNGDRGFCKRKTAREFFFLVVVVLVKFEVFLAISDNGTLGCEQRRL